MFSTFILHVLPAPSISHVEWFGTLLTYLHGRGRMIGAIIQKLKWKR